MPALAKKSFSRWLRLILFFVLTGTLLPSAGLAPTPVQAETSADPDGEIVYIDNTGVVRILDILIAIFGFQLIAQGCRMTTASNAHAFPRSDRSALACCAVGREC